MVYSQVFRSQIYTEEEIEYTSMKMGLRMEPI